MIYDVSTLAVIIFFIFVALVLALSFYFAGKTKMSSSYFAAGGTIHWGRAIWLSPCSDFRTGRGLQLSGWWSFS